MIPWVSARCCRRSLASRLSNAVSTASTSTFVTCVRRVSSTSSSEASRLPGAASVSGHNNANSSGSRADGVSATSDVAAKWSAALPDIPYGFPESGPTVFAAERSGGLQKRWLQELPRQVVSSSNSARSNIGAIRVERYLPNKDDFWRSPPYEALREIVLRIPYHDALKLIMEHDYRFLFSDVMCNTGAPMPHVIYEDFMKCLTFSSRQLPPEEQFALPVSVLRDVLCWAAYYCTLDRFYFTSAHLLFRKVEQEQHMSPAVHSAWVYICTAAGKLEEALAYAAYMEAHSIPFDADVFARFMHPSLTPVQQHLQQAPQTSKGVMMQRRLCQDMSQHHGTMSVAVHAMFVYHILTLQHTRKWEVLRGAAERFNQTQRHACLRSGFMAAAPITSTAVSVAESPQEVVCSRTMQLAMSLFCREKGVRWGPRTTKEMVAFMLANEEAGATMADVLFVLLRIRRNERAGMLAALPRTAFSAEEQEVVMRATYHRAQRDPAYAVAGPLLRELLAADGISEATAGNSGSDSNEAVDRVMGHLQKLASSVPDYGAYGVTSTSSIAPAPTAGTPHRGEEGGGASAEVYGAAVDDEQCSLTSLSEAMAEQQRESDMPSSPAETARDLLAAVMALDLESVAVAPAARKASGEAQTTLKESSRAASLETPVAPEEDRLRNLYVSLEAMGTPSSLSAWSLQQLQREEEEARLHRHAANAWISPTYVLP
ncbi:hypothetical protein, conserved [Leishmania tarentolae]|uniref:Uncharacterized protein n=1 Tax=Leishmania tarentolae TaxID=5689 RepID=A0A640KKF8_LEITA|nr:hypothetical protein, conserved [Leishmania tarentolae]